MLVSTIRALILLSILLPPVSAHAEEASVLRVFLADGTTLTSFGEYARVGDRIVFSMPLGSGREGNPTLQLVSLPERNVDWTRTDAYREAVRSAQYAAAQGENDFALMTGDVARVLNEIALAKDPAHRLRLAEQARAQLTDWPAKHYGYRAKDVREIAALLDETIADLRAATGGNQVDLSFVANVEPPAPVLLLPPPTRTELIAQALSIAEMADVPADRIAMLQKAVAFIDTSPAAESDPALLRARDFAWRRLEQELDLDQRYTGLVRRLTAEASTSAARADVRGVERVIARVARVEEQFGPARPADVRSLIATLHAQLDSARRLRLARDRWRLRLAGYRSVLAVREIADGAARSHAAWPAGHQDAGGPRGGVAGPADRAGHAGCAPVTRRHPAARSRPHSCPAPERVPDGECRRGDALQGRRVRRHGGRLERLLGGGRIADAAGAGP